VKLDDDDKLLKRLRGHMPHLLINTGLQPGDPEP
jgi:hypothetical protein